MSLKHYLEQLIKESEKFYNNLFEPDNRWFSKNNEIYGVNVDLSLDTVESISSIAHELQEELRKLNHHERLKYWESIVWNLCEDIINLTSDESKIYKLAKFNFYIESAVIKNFENNFLEYEIDQTLDVTNQTASDKHETLISAAKEDVYILEEKIKQVIALVDFIVNAY
jgi:hypothetical protein